MPSFNIKNSSNCCITRDPPSPDGLAPRPALLPSKPKGSSKNHISSWDIAETKELRDILEQTILDTSDEPNLPRAQGTGDKLKAILEGDITDTDDRFELKTKQSFNPLELVKQKLKKRLSRDSALSKRHSRTSIGTSEEEIERRAELRRIRERRIREELSSEGIYDEDAKSLSSFLDIKLAYDKKHSLLWTPGDFLPPLVLVSPKLEYPVWRFPGLGFIDEQKDALRDATLLAEDRKSDQTPRPRSTPPGLSFTGANSSGTLSRRHSSPALWDQDFGHPRPLVYVPSRKRSSLPPVPHAPTIEPKRLPSIAEPTSSSWRLSFSAENRGDHLRKLSQGNGIPLLLTPEQISPQPVRKWLHSQGLRSASQVIASSDDNSNLESLASHSQTCSATQEFGSVDGPEDGATIIHLHEMGISQRLASRGLQSSSSSPQLSSWGSHQRGVSSISGITQAQAIRNERARYMQNTSDSIPLSERIPQTWGAVIQDGTSSFYPSVGNRIQPSPESSQFNLVSLLSGGKSDENVVEQKELDAHELSSRKAVSTINGSSTSLAIPLVRQPRRLTIDDNSILASETESFREREAELSVVETRFAASEARRVPSTPRSSKFREEFDFKPQEADTPINRKPSAIARLARLAIKSYDGGMEDLMSVPVPDFEPSQLKPRGGGSPYNPYGDDDADDTGLWGRALKKNADAKANETREHLQIPVKRARRDSRKKSTYSDEIPKGALGTLKALRKSKRKEPEKSAAEEYQERFQERLAVKEQVMDSWEAEMDAIASKSKIKSRNIVKKSKPSGPDRRYPASWARFPSHSRSERSLEARSGDKVDTKDFALKCTDNGKTVWYHSERTYHLYHHDDDDHPSHLNETEKGITGKVLEKLGVGVVDKTESIGLEPNPEQTYGRRSSLNVGGALEYPELEILPVVMKRERELANEVYDEREEKRRRGLSQRMVRNVDGSLDGDEDEMDISMTLSIADPRFYDDCVPDPAVLNGDGMEMKPKTGYKEKYSTWSGKDWEGYKSYGTIALRKSTDAVLDEFLAMEKVEREKVLQHAEEAWGRKK